jgi:hypothetical protein
MARRNQFTVDAESVQGNAGATVTFRRITVGQRKRYLEDKDYNDPEIVGDHIADWSGIEDDEGHEIPSPKDEPGVVATLYVGELRELVILLFAGPGGDQVKN